MKSPLIVTSVGFHIAVVAGFFVAGLWKLERLDAERRPIDIAVAPPPAAAASGSPAAAPTTFTKKKPKVITKDLVQPKPEDLTARPAATTTTDTGGTGGTGPGPGSGSGNNPTGNGDCVGDHCDDANDEDKEKKIPPKPPEVLTVPPSVLKAIRISGDTQLQPPNTVKTAILRDGKTKVTAAFKVCIDATGEVGSVTKLQSSGYEGYDRALDEGIRRWRYRAYEVDGRKVQVCGVVTFIYQMQ